MSADDISTMALTAREQADDTVVLEIRMSRKAYDEFINGPGNDSEAAAKGLGRDEYCVTCHGKDENGNQPRTTEKALSSVLAHLQGAPKCMAITGDPGNSVSKGKC